MFGFFFKFIIFLCSMLTLKVWKLNCGNWQTFDFHCNYTFVKFNNIHCFYFVFSKLCVLFSRKKIMFTCLFTTASNHKLSYTITAEWWASLSRCITARTLNGKSRRHLPFDIFPSRYQCRARKWRLLIAI